MSEQPGKEYGSVKGPYNQPSVRERILALFLDNVGKVLTRSQILEAIGVSSKTGEPPENWHQRLSELRTDYGYTILTKRDRPDLQPSEYLMPHTNRREAAKRRVYPSEETWAIVLERANHACEWSEDGYLCGLREGDMDPIGGGTVKLTPDHRQPHSVNPDTDPNNPDQWRALCGRHQVMKKNYWNDATGKIHIRAILQAISKEEKMEAFKFLQEYFSTRGQGTE